MSLNDEAVNDLTPMNGVYANWTLLKQLDEILVLMNSNAFKDWTVSASDSVKLLDNFLKVREKLLTDVMVLADSVFKTAIRGLTLNDAAVLADEMLKRLLFTQQFSEAVVLTDGAIKTTIRNRWLADAVILADNKTAIRFKTRDEALTLLDSFTADVIAPAGGTVYTLTKDESLVLADSLVRGVLRGRVSSEAMIFADGFFDSVYRNRTQSDTAVLTDSTGRRAEFYKQLSEFLTLADYKAVVRLKDIAADGLVLVDSTLKFILRQPTMSDALTLFSQNAFKDFGATLTDVINTTDGFQKTVVGSGTTYTKNLAEGLVLSDVLGRMLFLNRAQLESIILTDQSILSRYRNRMLSDTAVLTDDKKLERVLTKQDQLTLLDSAIAYKLRGKTLTDTTTLADAIIAGLLRVRILTDNAILVDSFTKTVLQGGSISRVLSDALTLRDVNVWRDWTAFMVDPLILTDSKAHNVLRGNVIIKNRFDTMLLVDSVIEAKHKVLVDIIKLNDTEGRYNELQLTADEDLALDSGSPQRFFTNLMVDTIRMADSIGSLAGTINTRVMDNTLVLTDGAVKYQLHYRALFESLVLPDSYTPAVLGSRVRVLDDAIQITDASQKYLLRTRQLQDFVAAITDSKALLRVLTRTDNFQVSDGQTSFRIVTKALLDEMTLEDSLDFFVDYIVFEFFDVRVRLAVDRNEVELDVDRMARLAFDRFLELALDNTTFARLESNRVELDVS